MKILISDVSKLLRKIEWEGQFDYSIGVSTCPCCGRRGGVREDSQWYQGHHETCELSRLLYEIEHDKTDMPDKPVNCLG